MVKVHQTKIQYDKKSDDILIESPIYMKAIAQSLKSRRWDKALQMWRVPANIPSIEDVLLKYGGRPDVHVDPRVHQTLEKKRGESWTFMALKEKGDLTPEMASYKYVRVPFPHQVAGTEAILRRPKVLLLDQMGLGKTKQMIDAAVHRMSLGKIKRGVVICPASLKWNWKHEIELNALAPFRNAVVIDGNKKERDEQWQRALSGADENGAIRWIIINYESARMHPEEMALATRGQMLMCDEAQKIKNMKAKTTKLIHAIAPEIPYIVLATGTPVANTPEDVYSLTELVEHGLLGASIWAFMDQFTERGGYEGREIVGYRNLADFRKRLGTVSIRRLKETTLGLPPKVYERRDIAMSADQQTEYDRMRDEMVAIYKDMNDREFALHAANAHTKLIRLKQIADGFIQDGDKRASWFPSTPKMAELDEIVEEVVNGDPIAGTPGGKIVIWSYFRAVTAALEERYKKFGAVRIFGDVPNEERFKLVERFQNDPECKVFVGQVHTGGLGLNLTAANVQVFYDRWWSPSINEQAEDRLHRIGMKGTVTVLSLVAKNSIDAQVMKLLDSKKEWADVITGDDIRLNKKAMMMLLGEEEGGSGNSNEESRGRRVSGSRQDVGGVRPARSGRGSGKEGVQRRKAGPRKPRMANAR